MGIFTFNDLLQHYPFRHIDKTKIDKISNIHFQTDYTQVAGVIKGIEILGERKAKRLTAWLEDETGSVELVWFQGVQWIQKSLSLNWKELTI